MPNERFEPLTPFSHIPGDAAPLASHLDSRAVIPHAHGTKHAAAQLRGVSEVVQLPGRGEDSHVAPWRVPRSHGTSTVRPAVCVILNS